MEKRFICGLCGAAHARREHLERHRTAHSDERPHGCPACLKTFKRQEHLARHMLTHAGIKPHVCHICSKAFYRKDHLRKHSAAHQLKQIKAEGAAIANTAVVQEIPIQQPDD
ncbi:unnamed protein product, partial [Nesidiocoris tenuis]